MNVDQIIRLAMYQADAVKKAGTFAPFVTTAELYTWAQSAASRLEAKLRMLGANYFERNMLTGDSAETIFGQLYTPSTTLAFGLSSTVNTLTLPPDFRELRSIRVTTSGFENVIVQKMDHSSQQFRALQSAASEPQSPGTTIYYDIISDKTLIYHPKMSSQLNIELKYIAKPKKLYSYSTGTLSVTDATTAVTGVGTLWAGKSWDSAYLDILWSASATVPTPEPNLEYDSVNMSQIASITDNTHLVLAAVKNGTISGKAYLISSRPIFPEEYQFMMADYLTGRILLKAGDQQGANGYMGAFTEFVGDAVTTAARRQTQDAETVEDWDPWG